MHCFTENCNDAKIDSFRKTYTTSGEDLGPPRNLALLVGHLVTHQIVHGEFDGLLRGHAHQLGHEATVQPEGTLVTNDLESNTVIKIILDKNSMIPTFLQQSHEFR